MKKSHLLGLVAAASLIVSCSTLTPKSPPVVVEVVEKEPTTSPDNNAPKITTPNKVIDKTSFTQESYTNLLDRLISGYQIEHGEENDQSQRFIKHRDWYIENSDYLVKILKRSEPFLYYIVEQLEKRNLPLELAFIPVVESAYKPEATSGSKAAGLWQFIPATGRYMGLQQTWWGDHRRDAILSTDKALDYLTILNKQFDGDWKLALAAYNGGRGTIRKAIRKNENANLPTDFYSLDLSRETRNYLPKVMAVADVVQNSTFYDINLPTIDNVPYLEEVELNTQLDILKLIQKTDLEQDEFNKLNASFKRWATSPDGPHRLVVPLSKADNVRQYISTLPANFKIRWKEHSIQSGDTLYGLSLHYKVSVNAIKKINKMTGSKLRINRTILIPLRS